MLRLAAFHGRGIWATRGWEAASEQVRQMLVRHPEPSPSYGRIERRNLQISASGDMAWAYYDQMGPETGDPFQMNHLHHELKILRRRDGTWRLCAIVILQTNSDFFDCPMVRIAPDGTVAGMNDAARRQLSNHPALIVSGMRLRACNRTAGRALSEAIDGLLEKIVVMARFDRSVTTPVILTDADGNGTWPVWVGIVDAQVVVTFDDTRSTDRRLDAAATLFRLSETQRRLCREIAAVADLAAAAGVLGITVNTARTHLQRVFDKTGARSQAALIRALMSVTPPG